MKNKNHLSFSINKALPLMAIGMGISLGIVVIQLLSSDFSLMWMIAVLLALAMPFLALLSGNPKRFFILIIVMTIPVNIDVTIGLQEHIGGAAGFIIALHNIAALTLIAGWILDSVRRKEWKLYLYKRSSLPIYGIMLFALFSMFNAVDVRFSIFEFIELIKMYLVFICIANYVAKTRDVKTIILFSLVGLGLEITLALSQFIFKSSFGLTALGMRDEATIFDLGTQYIHRVSGTLGNANSLGWYFNFLLPIPLALLFYKTHIKYRILVFILALSGILALFFTFSRASWFCFLLSVAIVISLLLIHASLKKKVYITILVALLAILLGIGFLITDNPVKERFLQDDKGSAYTRIPLMQVAFTMIKAHPLIGVGLNNYTLVHQEYDETADNITYYFPHTVHNVYLLLAAEIGIPGLLFFLMLTIHIIKRALKYIYNSSGYIKYVLIGIIAGLVGFLLHGLVDSGTIATYKFLPFWFYCGLVLEITHHIHDLKRW